MRKVFFIFSELTDADVEWLAKAGERVHVAAGTPLIPLSSRVEHLYVVLEGELDVRNHSNAPIAKLGAGEIVGEMSLVDPAPTTVSVVVASDALLLRIANEDLHRHLAVDYAFAARFYRAICVFLADRMRASVHASGYAEAQGADRAGEPNEKVLDGAQLAGARFDRMLKKLTSG